MRLIIFLVFPMLILACNAPRASSENYPMIYQFGDTLKPHYPLPRNSICLAMAEGYFNRFGINISNFYHIEDVIPSKMRKRYNVDSFAILSPLSLIPSPDIGGNCSRSAVDTIENRLLVLIKKAQIVVYPNVMSNDATIAFQSFEDINTFPNGFVLSASQGQGYVFDYSIIIENINGIFYVKQIKLARTPDFKEKIILFKKKVLPLDKYKREMIDSLRTVYDI